MSDDEKKKDEKPTVQITVCDANGEKTVFKCAYSFGRPFSGHFLLVERPLAVV